MKWLIVVIFAGLSPEGDKDLYVFTNPTFDNPVVCQSDISNPDVVPILVKKVVKDNGPRPIERVMCMLDTDLIQILEQGKKEESTESA